MRLQDLGVSGFTGANAQTGALSRFVLAIQSGLVLPGSILIVENLDRLSRSQLLDALDIFGKIVRSGVKVVTLKPEREYTVDTIGDDYVMMEAIFDMMRAHRESKRKSDLGKAAWHGKRAIINEKPPTARVPAWIEVIDGRFDEIPEYVAIIRQIFTWAIQGHGIISITKRLNEQGQFIGRVRRWNKSYVQKIIHNRAVLGEFQPHTGRVGSRQPIGDPIPAYYPNIISEADFYAAQAALTSRQNQRGSSGKNVRNLFTRKMAGFTYVALDGTSVVQVSSQDFVPHSNQALPLAEASVLTFQKP